MKWVTRARPKTDRIACPWLIRRFIDSDAQILFVPAEQVLDVAAREGGHSFDAKGATYTHRRTPEEVVPGEPKQSVPGSLFVHLRAAGNPLTMQTAAPCGQRGSHAGSEVAPGKTEDPAEQQQQPAPDNEP